MKKILGKLAAGGVALGLCLSVAACNVGGISDGSSTSSGTAQAAANTYLVLDINPTVELLVSEGKVVGVKAGNDDAGVLLSGEDLTGLTVEQVILTESGGGRAQVTVGLTWQGEALSVTVEVS